MKKIAARDGAYDKRYVYRMTSRLVIHPVTPTRKNARYDQKGDWGVNGKYRDRAIFTSRGYSARTRGKSKLITINDLSLKLPRSELKGCSRERLKNRTLKINGVKQR